ncbi:extensin family protein [Mycobacterium paraseoulense]|nr:extensin family protein [Mycobacterium paraseoulense]MCV7398108.1 hypothetical protein [Mycobacterium paraseoulense]
MLQISNDGGVGRVTGYNAAHHDHLHVEVGSGRRSLPLAAAGFTANRQPD